jgi:hypothetical protein
LGAFFAALRRPQKTGLSACIFFACGKKGYRSYPIARTKTVPGTVLVLRSFRGAKTPGNGFPAIFEL